MNILYLPLEFESYEPARKWPYPLGVGLVEGLKANGADVTVIPMFYHNNVWVQRIEGLILGQKFDQVWLEVVHTQIPQQVLSFLGNLAPVRVGLVCESLTIHQDEWVANHVGTQRRVDNLNQKRPLLTHALVTDARDLYAFNIPTLFQIAHVPDWFLQRAKPGLSRQVQFFGSVYGEREQWLARLSEKGLLCTDPLPPLDYQSGLAGRYDALMADAVQTLSGKTVPIGYYPWFLNEWLELRKRLYLIWSTQLTCSSFGVLNPPHRTSVLSSRVVESMAVERVVFSPLMGNVVDNVFCDMRDIVLYGSSDDLVRLASDFSKDASLSARVAKNGYENIRTRHTTDLWVKRVLNFIEGHHERT